MSDELVDDLTKLATSIASKWASAWQSPGTAPQSMQDVWMLWAEGAGDMVQAGYLWMQLIDRCCGITSTSAPSHHHPNRRTTSKATHSKVFAPGTTTVPPDLHPTAFLDGHGNVLPPTWIDPQPVTGPGGTSTHVALTVTAPSGTATGRYSGSVMDDEANLILDRVEIVIT